MLKKSTIGGQAIMEGVMMKAPDRVAIAVRKPNGDIDVRSREVKPLKDKHKIYGWPVIRGVVNFFDTMVLGVRSLMYSAKFFDDPEAKKENEPSKFETFIADKLKLKIEDVMIAVALVMAFGLAILLFMVIPVATTSLFRRLIQNDVGLSLIEGVVKLIIFFVYILAISKMKDIQRVFQYHGAEHKTIHCYENGLPLTPENAMKQTRLHPRCGTSFLIIVLFVSIIVFSFLSWENLLIRIASKLILLPVVAGVSYEVLRGSAKTDSKWVNIIKWPGIMMQKLTTAEPDEQQLEVAIASFQAAAGELQTNELDFDIDENDLKTVNAENTATPSE